MVAATIIIVVQYFSSTALEKQSKPLPHCFTDNLFKVTIDTSLIYQ